MILLFCQVDNTNQTTKAKAKPEAATEAEDADEGRGKRTTILSFYDELTQI